MALDLLSMLRNLSMNRKPAGGGLPMGGNARPDSGGDELHIMPVGPGQMAPNPTAGLGPGQMAPADPSAGGMGNAPDASMGGGNARPRHQKRKAYGLNGGMPSVGALRSSADSMFHR